MKSSTKGVFSDLSINLKPYFDEIQMHLNNQYLLTFSM